MSGYSCPPLRPAREEAIALATVLFLVTVVVVLVLLLYWEATRASAQARSVRCKGELCLLYKGARIYLNSFEEFFPVAWHSPGEPLADLTNVTYHRFSIFEWLDPSFNHVVRPNAPPSPFYGDESTAEGKFTATRLFWQCPEQGWTRDYFAPEIVFRLARGDSGRPVQHTSYNDLVAATTSTEQPLLTEVDASYAQGAGAYRNSRYRSPAHKMDVESGWQITRCLGSDVFLGVGSSLRDARDYTTSRFDFRHNRACHVLFLDSHISAVYESDTAQLQRIHDRWNHLVPPGANEQSEKP